MNEMMTDSQAYDLLNSPGMQVNHIEKELSQAFVMDESERVRIKCASPKKAKSIMFLARQLGMDSYVRCSVLTVFIPLWMSGAEEKLIILAGQCS